jgi:hypothetical protein
VSWQGLRAEESSRTAPQTSAEGIVGSAQATLGRHPKAERQGNREAEPQRGWAEGPNGGKGSLPDVERGDGIRRGVGSGAWDELTAGTPGDERSGWGDVSP